MEGKRAPDATSPASPMRHAEPFSDGRNFFWTDSSEPHAHRRRAILAKYPQIAQLFRPEPRTLPAVLLIVFIQICMANWAQTASWIPLLIAAYVVGGTLNHSLQLAVHELSHNLCFESPSCNKVLALFCNLPTGVPSAIMFQKYHMEHHQQQGTDGVDTDIPSDPEVAFFTNTVLKVLWIILQPLFYAGRPLLIKPKKPGHWGVLNTVACLSFDLLIYHFIGGRALAYLIIGTLLGLGLHPAAGHFVAEHYVLTPGYETYSYYGFWNWLNFNVGYHNEHHDFPRIPWTLLPKVRKIAPEFYNTLPSYTSYVYVMWRYITDPRIGPFARVKRAPHAARNSPIPGDSANSTDNSVTPDSTNSMDKVN